MKKLISLLLILSMLFASCALLVACSDSDQDDSTPDKGDDTPKACETCVDDNKDAKCDVCGKDVPCVTCADANKDAKCDVCGKDVPCETCVDGNKDAKCDVCGKDVPCETHTDVDPKDLVCDVCQKKLPCPGHHDTDGNGHCDECGKSDIAIINPADRDYLHDLAYFTDIVYERPDVEAAALELSSVAEQIKTMDDFDAAIELIDTTEDDYVKINTMYTYSEIMNMLNTDDQYWTDEYSYMSTAVSTYNKALEDLFVACATSPFKERFEDEYFKDSLDEYVDGGKYTDELVRLEALEGELIAEYVALEQGNIDRAAEIYVELVKIRRQIADELNLDTYLDYSYDRFSRDYSGDEALALMLDAGRKGTEMYFTLQAEVFGNYFRRNQASTAKNNVLINNVYRALEGEDELLVEAYAYMLETGLYDIGYANNTRYGGAFTTYISQLDAPFIFMSTAGNVTDYLTLVHEFGHFFDAYANYGLGSSLDLAEISSQALELMMISRFDGILTEKDAEYMAYYQLYMALNTLLYQSFIATFEHYVYDLAYDEITIENLEKLVKRAQINVLGRDVGLGTLDAVIMQHTVAYPFYVESYCTSLLVSLDIFFTECANKGDGMEIYLSLITDADADNQAFLSELDRVGLTSPFEDGYVTYIADSIYYFVTGKHYYQ